MICQKVIPQMQGTQFWSSVLALSLWVCLFLACLPITFHQGGYSNMRTTESSCDSSQLYLTQVGLLVLPCTCQCRRSTTPFIPSPFFSWPGQRSQRRSTPLPMIGVHYSSFSQCAGQTLWPDLTTCTIPMARLLCLLVVTFLWWGFVTVGLWHAL